MIRVQQEVDGTPCTVPGMQGDSQWTSQCMGGVCLQLQSSHALKRAKRTACRRRKPAKKIINIARQATEIVKKIAEGSSGRIHNRNAARVGGGAGIGGARALGRRPGSIAGGGSSALDLSGHAAGMLQGARIGPAGVLPRQPDGTFPRFVTGSYGGANAGPGATFPGVIGGANVAALPGLSGGANVAALPSLSGELSGKTSQTPIAGSRGAQGRIGIS